MPIPIIQPLHLAEALRILAAGGIVAHATETCYGLACDLTNPRAVERLFRVKNRPFDLPVSALFPSVYEAKKHVIWNDEAEALAKQYLPGPLTLILLLKDNHQPLFSHPSTTSNQQPVTNNLGIRVSSHPVALELATRFAKPLSTTSANLHGKPNTYGPEEILAQFRDKKDQPDLILDSGPLAKNPPSTVIDLTKQAKILRQGLV